MHKGKLAWWVILFSILAILFYFKSQQDSQAKAKAFQVAVEKAKSLGYDVTKMVISKEDLQDKTLIVSFKNSAQNKINDLEIYLHCDNIYDIDILGVFKDVDPVKDREKIIIQLTKDAVSELKGIMQNKDSGAK